MHKILHWSTFLSHKALKWFANTAEEAMCYSRKHTIFSLANFVWTKKLHHNKKTLSFTTLYSLCQMLGYPDIIVLGTKCPTVRYSYSSHPWEIMIATWSCFLLGKGHRQWIPTALKLGHEPRTNICESNIPVITLLGSNSNDLLVLSVEHDIYRPPISHDLGSLV